METPKVDPLIPRSVGIRLGSVSSRQGQCELCAWLRWLPMGSGEIEAGPVHKTSESFSRSRQGRRGFWRWIVTGNVEVSCGRRPQGEALLIKAHQRASVASMIWRRLPTDAPAGS